MYKIVSFGYESVIPKKFAQQSRTKIFLPPNHKSVPTALYCVQNHLKIELEKRKYTEILYMYNISEVLYIIEYKSYLTISVCMH